MPRLLIAIIIVAGLWGNGWCQTPRATSAVDLAKYSGADRERLLYDGAKKEGKLVWYTSLSTYKEVAKTFETKYPGVTVEFYRAPATNLATRILGESSARRYLADTIETTPGAIMLLRDNKLLLPYYSAHLGGFPEGSKEKAPGGLVYATVDRESYPGVGYNRNAIRDADVPKNFDDLLKPSLKGKIGISGEEIGARVVGAMLRAKGEAFVKKLAAQEGRLYSIPALGLNELVVSGEVPLTFTAVDSNIRLAAARGAPVSWLPMDLVPVNAGSVAALANTQRPNAALLFIDFIIGPDGQKLLVDKLGYGGARKEYPFKRWYPEQGLSSYDYAQTLERWHKTLQEVGRK
ncbi:MAG: ABC transporter substrate-binding protein [Candidatus Binatia bacterium]